MKWHAVLPVHLDGGEQTVLILAGREDGAGVGRAKLTAHAEGAAITIDDAALRPGYERLIAHGYTPLLRPKVGKGRGGGPVLLAVELTGLDLDDTAHELRPGPAPVPSPLPPRPKVNLDPI
jgi:hypothetical protein